MFASDFRAAARQALKGNWFIAVLVGLIASLLGGALSSSGSGFDIELNFQAGAAAISVGPLSFGLDPAIFLAILPMVLVVLALGLVFFALGSVVSLGYARFNLNLIDGGEDLRPGILFDYFPHFWNAFLARFFMALYTFLWTLLLIVPGIMAGYSYAMVPYILAEDPTIPYNEAIALSKEMMYGYRWRLFCLHVSFIGWAILCMFTLGIGNLWLHPYQEAAQAAFYRNLQHPTKPMEIVW